MKSKLIHQAALFILFTLGLLLFCYPALAEEAELDIGQDIEIDSGSDAETEDVSDDLGDDFEDDSGGEPDDLGDDFDDFEEGEADDVLGDISADTDFGEDDELYEGPSPVSINGHLAIESSYNYAHKEPGPGETDWRGLSKLRSEFQLEIDAKLSESWQMFVSGDFFNDYAYTINGRDDYTKEVLDTYQQQNEIRKAYIQGSLLSSLDIKVGRQIIVWGRSDNIRVTDVLNPMDLREPGLTDIEDVRMPVTMTRVDFYHGDWNITGVAVHEQRTNKDPAYGGDFYPLPLVYGPIPYEEPSSDLDNTGFAAAVNGVFSGWDVSFYYSYLYSHEAHVEIDLTPAPSPVLRYADITMTGTAFNITDGDWLFKGEAAYFTGIRFSDATGTFNTNTYSRIDVLGGIEYMGFDETSLSLDIMNSHCTDFDDAAELMGAEEHGFQTAARITRDFLNETLSLTLLGAVYGTGDDGAYCRFTTEYDATDNVEIIGGVVIYAPGDLPSFQNIGDNDRIYCTVKYSF